MILNSILILLYMGIDNFLPFFKAISQKMHLKQFKGKTLGIDMFPWLYKACYASVMQMDQRSICAHLQKQTVSQQPMGQNQSISCVTYLLQMINLFQQNEVKMIAVYDGRSLNMKDQTIKKRIKVRDQNLQKGKLISREENSKEMRKCLARGLRIAEPIIQQSMRLLKSKNIEFMVAPYQSDSQLCKLYRMPLIDAVVSEDSDLLVYGCKVLYKLDQQGICNYIDIENIEKLVKKEQSIQDQPNRELNKTDLQNLENFYNFDNDSRTVACVLAGCDYVASVKGIGVKTAIKLVSQESDVICLIQKMRQNKKYADKVPSNYEQNVIKALTIFKHALVYNPILHCVQPLSPLERVGKQQLEIIGQPYLQYITLGVYQGVRSCHTLALRNLDPFPLEKVMVAEIKPISLKQVKSVMKNRWSCSIQQQSDNELRSVAGENEMFQVFQNLQKSFETAIHNFANINLQNEIL